jgi:hypothetical protein
MNMREKMARAMHRRSDRGHCDWGDEHPNVRREFTAMADAALSAMEEPTEAMVWAALSRPIAPQASTSDLYRLLFRNMIRAARD